MSCLKLFFRGFSKCLNFINTFVHITDPYLIAHIWYVTWYWNKHRMIGENNEEHRNWNFLMLCCLYLQNWNCEWKCGEADRAAEETKPTSGVNAKRCFIQTEFCVKRAWPQHFSFSQQSLREKYLELQTLGLHEKRLLRGEAFRPQRFLSHTPLSSSSSSPPDSVHFCRTEEFPSHESTQYGF